MSVVSHKGQILPLANQVIPINQNTTLHASFNEDLNGRTLSKTIRPLGYEKSVRVNGKGFDLAYGKGINPFSEKTVIDMWVKPESTNQGMVISAGGNGNNQRLYIGVIDNRWDIGIQGSAWTTGALVTATTSWTHVKLEMGSGTANLYVNGVLSRSKTYTSYTLVGDFRLGAHNGVTDIPFTGEISDVKIYHNDILSAWYKLNEGEGLLACDYVAGNDSLIADTAEWKEGRIVATIRTGEGKYGNAIAIEQSTINLLSSPLTWEKDQGATVVLSGEYEGEPVYKVTFPTGTNPRIWQRIISTNEIFSGYFYAKLAEDTDNRDTALYFRETGFGANYGSVTCNLTDEWQKFELENITCATDFMFLVYQSSSTIPMTSFYMTMPQAEKSSFTTSYIDGNRPWGFLAYPKEVINPNEGTISMWLYAYGTAASYPVFSSGVDNKEGAFDFLISDTINPYLRVYGVEPANTQLRPNINVFNSWNHIVITWKQGEFLRCYGNGNKLVESLSPVLWGDAFIANATGFYLGSGTRSNPNILIDDLRIDKVAVSESDIVSWYVGGPHYNSVN
jgi:hypothetical protein